MNHSDLVLVAPACYEPPGLRLITRDRSIDLILAFTGEVWMHRPWKQLIDHRIGSTRSLGTTRLLAARVARACHLPGGEGCADDSRALAMTGQVVEFLEDHPRAQVFNAVGWVPDGAGLRLDGARSARWLRGRVPIHEVACGPLPELPGSAWFWIAADQHGKVLRWWCQTSLGVAPD